MERGNFFIYQYVYSIIKKVECKEVGSHGMVDGRNTGVAVLEMGFIIMSLSAGKYP